MNTVKTIREMKSKQKIAVLTCYTYFNAKIFDDAGIDILLVGDSLGNVVLGYSSTIPVSMNDMLHHSKIVSRAAQKSLVIADMPFMSYQISDEDAIRNAGILVKEGGVSAVKLEGGKEIAPRIKKIVEAGIPVMGHLGLLPQSVNKTGGYFVQGTNDVEANEILESAIALQNAGAFAVVLECVPELLAKAITEKLQIPTIGIGAGRFCDGQVLVFEDMVNMTFDKKKKFVKLYADLGGKIKDVANQYLEDVRQNNFPSEENILK